MIGLQATRYFYLKLTPFHPVDINQKPTRRPFPKTLESTTCRFLDKMLPRIAPKTPQLLRPHIRTLTASTNALNNRIYDPVRNDHDFHTLLRLTTTTSIPLLTLWTTSYCSSCRAVKPLLSEILERRNVGVGFAEVELDAPGMMDVGMRYTVNKVPTLLVFSRGEVKERVVDGKVLADRAAMEALVERVASEREVGRGWFTGVFGG